MYIYLVYLLILYIYSRNILAVKPPVAFLVLLQLNTLEHSIWKKSWFSSKHIFIKTWLDKSSIVPKHLKIVAIFVAKGLVSQKLTNIQTTAQKMKFFTTVRISTVNVTKSAVSYGFGHIYWRLKKSLMENFIICAVD